MSKNNKYLNDVKVCLEKYDIAYRLKNKAKDGLYVALFGINDKLNYFYKNKSTFEYTIRLNNDCNSDDMANAIVEIVVMRFSRSCDGNIKQMIHELYAIQYQYTNRNKLIWGAID